jgi:anaerobic magnesium-protoporphyrin IX monomethyl ester cyclase
MISETSKMLLVIPPCFTNRELDFEVGFPVNLLLLREAAWKQGWAFESLDMTLEEKEGYDSFAKLDRCLEDKAVKLVGISNHTVRTSVTTRMVAERVKRFRPDVKVVVGGVNATFMWRELLESCLAIDYILRGYGQPGLRVLCASLQVGSTVSIPGLVTRQDEGYHVEPMVSISPADFATPSLNGFDVARYLGWTTTYPLLTHSGCGFSCNFCTSVMPGPYQNKEVYRPLDDVIREMLQAIDAGFERFFMSANIFTSRRDYCFALCEAMCQAGIPERSSWVCMTRIEFVDEELLIAMRAAGCINIAFGIETASLEQWKTLHKGRFSKNSIIKAFHLTKQADIGTTAYLMIGAPSQTQEEIEATVELLREINPDYRVISFFQPFPGTPYWEHPDKFGLSEIAPLEEWNFHEAPICRTRHMDKRTLMDAAVRFYLDRGGEDRFLPSIDSLEPVMSPDQIYPDMPLPAQEAFFRLNAFKSIEDVLEQITEEHGKRGRLIALYWLSAALRDGVARVAKRREFEVVGV